MRGMHFDRLVVHDFFFFPDGGGKVAVILAQEMRAELYAGQMVRENFPQGYFGDIQPVSLQAYKNSLFWLKPSKTLQLWHAFARFPECSADRTIFSGALAPLAHGRIRGKKMLYCHTPPRFIYDQKKFYLDRAAVLKRPFLKMLMHKYRLAYARAIRDMDIVIANSYNVQKRIRHYLQRDSVVVHPPCDTRQYYCNPEQGYYLSTARLDSLKRVDLIVKAFLRMPDKRLIVASGGPEEQEIKRLAEGAPNIEMLGWVSDEKLKRLMADCIASIYIPREEDFGMSPVESMAAGKPVIGVAEGGLLETVGDKSGPGLAEADDFGRKEGSSPAFKETATGVLLKPDPGEEDVRAVVVWMTGTRARDMQKACQEKAKRFDTQNFIRKMKEVEQSI